MFKCKAKSLYFAFDKFLSAYLTNMKNVEKSFVALKVLIVRISPKRPAFSNK